MSQGLWQKKRYEHTNQTMIDGAFCQEYKVLVAYSMDVCHPIPGNCRTVSGAGNLLNTHGKPVSGVAGAVIVVLWLSVAVLGLVWVTKIGRKMFSS